MSDGGPYRGEGVNLDHALHEALEDAAARDPDFRPRRGDEPGKEYEILEQTIEAGNSHVHTFKVAIGP
jgi:hypothetical protein